MCDSVVELVAKLFKAGYTPEGVVTVLKLLAAEHEEGSDRRRDLEVVAKALEE